MFGKTLGPAEAPKNPPCSHGSTHLQWVLLTQGWDFPALLHPHSLMDCSYPSGGSVDRNSHVLYDRELRWPGEVTEIRGAGPGRCIQLCVIRVIPGGDAAWRDGL